MFFKLSDFSVNILSVHALSWPSKKVYIPPKRAHTLSFRIKGDARFLTDSATLSATDGTILFFSKGIDYSIDALEENLVAVEFETDSPVSEGIELYTPQNESFFREAFEELITVWRDRESGYILRAKSIVYSILARIESELHAESADPAFARIKPALKLMNSSYTDATLTVAAVAAYLGVSETYFRRVFSRIHGTSPHAYIMDMRISHAKELLSSGFYTVEQTAHSCGFADVKYFSTAFKRHVGISPSEYKSI